MNEELISRNKNINRGFRKLEVWKEAVEFYVFVKKKIIDLSNISYKIKDQIEASAFSVHSNIAEGYSRRYLKENIQFNNIALGYLAENYSQVFALYEADIVNRNLFDLYDSKHYSLENKLINYNRAQIKQLKNNANWRDDYTLHDIINKYGLDE
jgi:four helix bundle protein